MIDVDMPVEIESLAPFYERSLITDTPQVVKSGKEGTVYCCRAHPSTGAQLFAAKVYRPRNERTFRNDAIYREGRPILDKRLDRALKNKTKKGQEVQFFSWVEQEYETLTLLHNAGADVPKPVAKAESAILMEYVGDESAPARMLKHVQLEPDEVHPLLLRVLDNIELWLAHDRVHGDLSAFNILYRNGRITIIDFPQAIDPRVNPNAQSLLTRDLANVYGYWERYGVHVNPTLYANDLWWRFFRAEL